MIYSAMLKLEGVSCGGCFNRILQAINREDILRVIINHGDRTVDITYERERVYYQKIIMSIQEAGYNAKLISIEEEEE